TPGFYWGHYCNLQELPDHEIQQMIASYYGLISEVDDNVGQVINCLKQLGMYDDTLIVFTCDHGEQLGEHWLWDKGGYFDASYHIPLIVRDPKATEWQGQLVERFTESIDLMPTILEWLGLPVPQQCDGRSLLPVIRGQSPEHWRKFVHWEFDF